MSMFLALINRVGGLFFKNLKMTEVVSTDLTAFGLYTRPRSSFSHTDRLSSVMFITCCKQEQFNSFNLTGLYRLIFFLSTAMSWI